MFLKRQVPVLLAFLGGFIMLLDYFIAHPVLLKLNLTTNLSNWARIGFTFAIFIGIINLIYVNLKKITRLAPGWGYNFVLLICVFIMIGFGFGQGYVDDDTVYIWMYKNVLTPSQSTMFGLLTFFIASAAFRAFRAKNMEATLLLVTAIVVMLGNVPIGDLLVTKLMPNIDPMFLPSSLQDKIMSIINTAGQRAILLAASIGLIVFSIKILTGTDRSYFGGD